MMGSVNPILHAYLGSDFFGKAIFLSLFLLSIVTWSLFLKKLVAQKKAKRGCSSFATVFEKHRFDPLSLSPQVSYPFAHLYHELKITVLELLKKNQQAYLSRSDIELASSWLKNVCSLEVKKVEKNLYLLSTIASLAPFLGLLGTVWGILLTLKELQMTVGVQTSRSFMGDLSMALGTTVFGLLVAIPALIGNNYLRSMIREFAADLESFSQKLLATVELQYRKVDV